MALNEEDRKKVAKRIVDVLNEFAKVNPEVTMMDFVEVLDLVKQTIIKTEVKERLRGGTHET